MVDDDQSKTGPLALQRCARFVERTENWLYDHLRFVPGYNPMVFCNHLLNRHEFPALEAWCGNPKSYARRIWGRLTRQCPYPSDWLRLKRLAPCVLHSHFGTTATGDMMLQRVLDVPWVVSFYGADVYQGHQAERQQKYVQLFDKASRVLALGPAMQARLEQLGCAAKKITVHPLGVDIEHLPSRVRVLKSGEPLRLLFAGTFREKKGVQYVIEAAAMARRTGVRLELQLVGDAKGKPGDHETKTAIFQRLKSLDLEDIVTHHTFLSFQELVALALDSHIFVAPSVTAANGDAEGTPFVTQQMMATGMPVIATHHSDIPYIFGEQRHLLVPERDAGAIANRLQRYADDPDSLASDGAALRRQIRAFDIRQCAARLRDLYDAIR